MPMAALRLETERLLLRQFRDTDIDAYAAMLADPEVMRYIGEGKPLTRDDAWRNMAMVAGHWSLRDYGMWAAEERSSGAFVGRVGLYYPEGWPGQEVGWALARPYWGEGVCVRGSPRVPRARVRDAPLAARDQLDRSRERPLHPARRETRRAPRRRAPGARLEDPVLRDRTERVEAMSSDIQRARIRHLFDTGGDPG
jgi:hypothetical protein